MQEKLTYAANGEGWSLELRQYFDEEVLDRTRPPVVMFPGYCMNTFILNFHPSGKSMVRYLVDDGFEVWTANLRTQGGSKRRGGTRRAGFREFSLVDVPIALETVLHKRVSEREEVHAVGCSLGATFLFAYLAHHLEDHPLAGIVSVGGPLRWELTHPLLRVAFRSPQVASVVSIGHTRELARRFLPIALRVPEVLSLYMNTDHIDLRNVDQLVQTIDDPIPYLNVQISHWIRQSDLEVAGVDVTERMAHTDVPLMCIYANEDGIVPPSTARSAIDAFGTRDVTEIEAGDDENWFAHADLFINDEAQGRVFRPLSRWLAEHA